MKKLDHYKMPCWAVWAILGLLALPACFGLLQGQIINGHDATSNLIMALYMHQHLGDGQFFIRWASDINYGYGYPMFDFYPPGFFLLTCLVSKVISNVVVSMNLLTVFFWVLSGVGMYFWSREFWGEKGALLSSVAYMYMPYHIQDIYIRAAFSEFIAFAFFPLILLSFYKISKEFSLKYFLLGTMSIFVFTCIHTLMLMLFIPILMGYLLILSFFQNNKRLLLINFSMLLLGWTMSAFCWLPVAVDSQSLNKSFLFSMHIDFHKNFVSLQQLFHLPWGNTSTNNGLSLEIGLFAFLLSLIPLIFIKRILKQNCLAAAHYFFFLIITTVAIFFVLPYSQSSWEILGFSKLIQFPWRFLTIIDFSTAFLAGCCMLNHKGKLANFFLILLLVLLISCSTKYFNPVRFLNLDQTLMTNNLSSILYLGEGRFTPKWIKIPPMGYPKQKFEFVKGEGEITQYQRINSIEYSAHINAETPALICFHSFYFPGWKVLVDGKEAQIYPDNPYGVILFIAPAGDHAVKVAFGPTPMRSMAVMISWVALSLLVLSVLCRRYLNIFLR